MKGFKASKKNKNDELVENDNSEILFENNDNIDNKINEDLKEIKNKLNAEKLSDEFKKNLQAKLDEEYNKSFSKKKEKIFDFPIAVRKFAGACACFILLCSGCIAFADDIENIILHAFGNTDRIVKRAIAEGNYREIDMDYVEHEGVSIKVDYLVVEDDSLYIAFNILAEEEFDNVLFENMSIENDGELIHKRNKENIKNKNKLFKNCKSIITENEIMYVYQITTEENENINKLNIDIENIFLVKNDKLNKKNNIWKFNI